MMSLDYFLSGCGAKGTCPDVCVNYPIQNRIRHLNTDVGYALDFSFSDVDGLPEGCSAFDKTYKIKSDSYNFDLYKHPNTSFQIFNQVILEFLLYSANLKL